MKLIFLLLVIYQIKHFLADYPLQGEFMLGKFKPDWSFVKPLLAHVGVHAAMTFVIAAFLVPLHIALLLGMVDATIHFVMDRLKAGPKYLGRFKPLTGEQWMLYKQASLDTSNKGPSGWALSETDAHNTRANAKQKLRSNVLFWWALGLDQMVHHLTHYGVIYLIILFHH